MKPFVLILSFLHFSCNNYSVEHTPLGKDITMQLIHADTTPKVVVADASVNADTTLYVWRVDFVNKTKKKNPKFRKEYLNADTLIKGLNALYPGIKLDNVKMSGDTLVTKITDSEYFTERMGSSGAALYLADVIINLTSVDKIKYVKIDFEEGSHASPGTWCAKDFSDYKEIR